MTDHSDQSVQPIDTSVTTTEEQPASSNSGLKSDNAQSNVHHLSASGKESQPDSFAAYDKSHNGSLLKVPRAPILQRMLVLALAAAVLLIDQLTKNYVEQWLPMGSSWAPFPDFAHFFQITHTFNTGGVFGILPGWNGVISIIAVVVTGFILIYSWLLPAGNILLRVALGLQLGGALGNLVDRLRQGFVTDFMDFGPWPVWNMADLAIISGAVLLAVVLILEHRTEKRQRELAVAQSTQSFSGDLSRDLPVED